MTTVSVKDVRKSKKKDHKLPQAACWIRKDGRVEIRAMYPDGWRVFVSSESVPVEIQATWCGTTAYEVTP